ncbi:TSC22 domain family protein 2, partial [Varanus komodoensis]
MSVPDRIALLAELFFLLSFVDDTSFLHFGASGASVVAIDNKIEQAMDLVKSHLMYAVREEVEVLKEQIKELVERNSLLERENALLKSLSNNDQLSQLSTQQANPSSTSQQQTVIAQPLQPTQPPQQPNLDRAGKEEQATLVSCPRSAAANATSDTTGEGQPNFKRYLEN